MALILGIESSCDETAVAVVENGKKVISNAVSSQMAKHAVYGGIVPELAAREHLTAIEKVCNEAMTTAGVSFDEIDAIAVTHAPGLVPALLVGLNFAKGLVSAYGKPLIGINHFLAHMYGVFIDSEQYEFDDPALYPMAALVVSGGHTSIVIITEDGRARVVGSTIDDAAGECLDKGAKMLNLGYPGGPVIEKLAASGDIRKYNFPRSLTGTAGKALAPENRFNFSFSGLKTALLYHARNLSPDGNAEHLEGQVLTDTLASYQEAVVDVLCTKAFDAVKHFHCRSAILSGGVACNTPLRKRFESTVPRGVIPLIAPKKFCTDNAAMVAGLAYHYYAAGKFSDLTLDTFARLPHITEVPFRRRSA
ncbi:MAG TPA: tRNA (adenosine(37)-N6)-threonylcarbamoyltransferase complex transferase subunit TsaD [Lentisphaeria bacterium]|nr:tRNA (adenosine(37)-N6)-threonylcarbamoyltransferase complex transferase subunit TsaD [Lentisphaeria bacterium]HCG48691.1 tRNA (adenosine(37)-N6)-threonylcarbamoyltransferase complex transferase subunit TsaD [Lentisphaeria bacterium]